MSFISSDEERILLSDEENVTVRSQIEKGGVGTRGGKRKGWEELWGGELSSWLGSRRAAPLEMKRRPEKRREYRVLPWKWGQSASRMRDWPAAGRAAGTGDQRKTQCGLRHGAWDCCHPKEKG